MPLDVRAGNGIEVASGAGPPLLLDPARRWRAEAAKRDEVEQGRSEPAAAAVTHAHHDHLGGASGAHMTPPTRDFLRLRKPSATGESVAYREPLELGGFRVEFIPAGHLLGSAMVRVAASGASDTAGDILYTGDFNPAGSITQGRAEPRACHTLVIESTYGDPRFDIPPRDLVAANVEAWMIRKLLSGPVALGAHPLGRAQELIALANRIGLTPVVSAEVASGAAIYNAHGHNLAWVVEGSPRAAALGTNVLHIVPRDWLAKGSDFSRRIRAEHGALAFLSGWCHVYQYFEKYDIDAQFALSDHAGFRELVAFAEACAPKRVLTTHGRAASLARELRARGMNAEELR
ncbi:MAG: hypothetical protein ACYDCK_04480 [Thermoplasmatota archaeon]